MARPMKGGSCSKCWPKYPCSINPAEVAISAEEVAHLLSHGSGHVSGASLGIGNCVGVPTICGHEKVAVIRCETDSHGSIKVRN